jgi:DNA-3-methyladenine glycosylase II
MKRVILSSGNFKSFCDKVTAKDPDLKAIIETYGYPPMWSRPNTFETLVHIILEQQVSIASALAALNKLREKLKRVTPGKLLNLTDEALRDCYLSRQKIGYTRSLAEAIISRRLALKPMEQLPDEEVRSKLVALKGLGNWTADVYLIFVLGRSDIFPIGDLAAVNALKAVKKLPKGTDKERMLTIAAGWKPYRTVATMILWHFYLSSRAKNKKVAQKIEKAILVT